MLFIMLGMGKKEMCRAAAPVCTPTGIETNRPCRSMYQEIKDMKDVFSH